jgi:hypothetical protein
MLLGSYTTFQSRIPKCVHVDTDEEKLPCSPRPNASESELRDRPLLQDPARN